MTPAVRFAPSPTGDLHLGHAWSACCAARAGREIGAEFIVRIEDIDLARCRDAFIERQLEDLAWLGLVSARPLWRQSERMEIYRVQLERLEALGVVYPCFCTRAQIRQELEAMAEAPQAGVEGAPAYPGRCRHLSPEQRRGRIGAGEGYGLRLDSAAALAITGPLSWTDVRLGRREVCNPLGDVIIARKEMPTSYHLSVVVDDHAQGVARVTRGWDLIEATDVHRILQALLGLDVPEWEHHELVVDAEGRRLAKRKGAETLRSMRERGLSPDSVLEAAAAHAIAAPDTGAFRCP